METLTGTVERITYYNPENGYSVIKITPETGSTISPEAIARDGTVAVTGNMPEISAGEHVRLTGEWTQNSRYGLQFRAETVTPLLPATTQGIINYLSSGIVKGIGPRTAEKIVDYFGVKTLDVLEREPRRLEEVPGLRRNLARKLAQAWAENHITRQAMIFLQGYGISSKMAMRIFEHYGSTTIQTVKDNPYILADDVFGIGFMRADAIAQNMDIAPDDPNRIRAGLHFALNQLTREGHCYSPRSLLQQTATELLKVHDTKLIEQVLDEELTSKTLIADPNVSPLQETAVYLPIYYYAERKAAAYLRHLANTPSKLVEHFQHSPPSLASTDIMLTEQQKKAVQLALANKVSIITGGPGTGKTTTLRMLIHVLEAMGHAFRLASPTGRAARRLSEATDYPASTIHRLLEFSPKEGFLHNEDNPLDTEMVIVDETSMIDLILFYDLLRALAPETHLVLVGDVDQLPSVGAGNVLNDVISSKLFPVTRLNVIFRQSSDSYIIENAHRINNGEPPLTDNQSNDFYFFGEDDPQQAAELIVDIVCNRVPNKFGFHPVDDIQVVSPMYRGYAGVSALNTTLQQRLNGNNQLAEKQIGNRLFRVGDKIMQTRNNYDKDVFNGDIGRIHSIDFENQILEVVLDGRFIEYGWFETEDLIHAYCISTHRSQGSEYPVVVMPILTQHYMMLQRNLLYTAVTRAKKLVVLVGTRKAIHIAVNNNKVAERHSGLQARLQSPEDNFFDL